jgi:hypothetical protein
MSDGECGDGGDRPRRGGQGLSGGIKGIDNLSLDITDGEFMVLVGSR